MGLLLLVHLISGVLLLPYGACAASSAHEHQFEQVESRRSLLNAGPPHDSVTISSLPFESEPTTLPAGGPLSHPLPAALAAACGVTDTGAVDWQRRRVFSFQKSSAGGGQLSLTLCDDQGAWDAEVLLTLTCTQQQQPLEGEEFAAGCTCLAPTSTEDHSCPLGDFAQAATLNTNPGYWYYAVVVGVEEAYRQTGMSSDGNFTLSVGRVSGTFSAPTIIPPAPGLTEPASLAAGQPGLSPSLASLCGASPDSFTQQRSLVYLYDAASTTGAANTTFTLCSSGKLEAWLLACPQQLADSAGDDAAAARCTCTPAGEALPSCSLIGQPAAYGLEATIANTGTNPWYYVIAQASSPTAANDPLQTFTIAARRTGVPKPEATIRIVNSESTDATWGRLEVWRDGEWGTVCIPGLWNETDWGEVVGGGDPLGGHYAEAVVACRQLGIAPGNWTSYLQPAEPKAAAQPIWVSGIACNGSEGSLEECQLGQEQQGCQNHSWDAGIACSVQGAPTEEAARTVRIRNGPSAAEGRLEVLNNGIWGTICSVGFSDVDARVACRQLSFTNGRVTCTNNCYKPGGIGRIWLSNVNCLGSETRIEDCPPAKFNGWGQHSCTHSQDVGIRCW